MLKVCIIGSSGHWRYAVNGLALHNEIELAGIAPGSPGEDMESILKYCDPRGYQPELYADHRKMLDKIKPDITVVNCHFYRHAALSMECIQRGCHIFSEKPVATTMEDLAELKAAWSKSGVHFAAMFGIRYNPWFLTAYKAVEAGKIGEVRLMNAQKSYRLGNRSDFFRKRDTYGGTIPWVGSHAVDWLHWFCGRDFKTVFASHSTKGNHDHGDLENSALCHFTFAGDVFGSVNIDYLRPAKAPSHDDDRIRVAGTKGVVEVLHNKVYLINDEQEGVIELPQLPRGESFAEFLDQIKGSGDCMVSAEDSFLITEACLRARQSADEKRMVSF